MSRRNRSTSSGGQTAPRSFTSLWSLAATTILLSNIADFLDAVRRVSDHLYNLLIFDWNGATYLPWGLGLAGYALGGYLIYSTIRAKRSQLRREVAVAIALIPAIVLFGINVVALPFGERPIDVWNPVVGRINSRLMLAAAAEGGVRWDPANTNSERQAWSTAQMLVGLLARPTLGPQTGIASEVELVKHLEYLETARRDDQGGWGYFPNRSWGVTEIGAWVALANAYALQSPLVVSEGIKETLRGRILRDLANLAERQTDAGAWKPLDDRRYAARADACLPTAAVVSYEARTPTQTPDLTRTYSTVMAVWAIAEARNVPSLRAEVSRLYDGSLSQGVTWLLQNVLDDMGWTPNPGRKDTREAFPGLTAQTLFVLERIAQLQPELIQQRQRYREAKQDFLRLRGLQTYSLSENSRIPDSDLYLLPTDQVLEGSTFLWFPWSLATLTHLVSDPDLTDDDQRLAGRLRMRLLAMHDEALHNAEQALTYELAETLLGLKVGLGPAE